MSQKITLFWVHISKTFEDAALYVLNIKVKFNLKIKENCEIQDVVSSERMKNSSYINYSFSHSI